MSWITPIYDRTQGDVDAAVEQLTAWKQNGMTGTMPELKGCLNVSDMNRIEGNIAHIVESLNYIGYDLTLTTKTWTQNEPVMASDISRILSNLATILSTFTRPQSAPDVPRRMSSYRDINDIEQILDALYDAVIDTDNTFVFDISSLTGLTVSGVFNTAERRVEC